MGTEVTTIVVGVDESEGAAVALRWAAAEAAERGARVRAVLAWTYLDQPARPGTAREFDPAFDQAGATRVLDDILAERLGEGATNVEGVAVNDHAGPALVDQSADGDLLVVGARGLGMVRSAVLGSISNHCLHHAKVPVAVIGPDVEGVRSGPVVVGTDGSPAAKRAVAWAAAEARARDAELHVLVSWTYPAVAASTAMDPTPFEEAAAEVLAAALATVPDDVRVTGQTVMRGAPDLLIEASRTAAVTVVGSRGRGGFRALLLGSTSQQVAAHAHGPVVVVPSHGAGEE